MRFLLFLGSLALASVIAATAAGQFKDPTAESLGPKLGEARVSRWQVGVIVTAASGPCTGIVAYVPLPSEWPEQQLSVLEQDVSPSVSVRYEMVEGTVRVMVVSIPNLPAGEEAKALTTFEVRRHALLPPTSTESYQFPNPKKVPKDVRGYLAPSPKIESTNPKIKALVKQIAGDHTQAWGKVEAIYDWVRQKVEIEKGPAKGALAALRDGKGQVEDATALFIAVCRAANIPARTVWVAENCYPEFYLLDGEGKGRWFPCDMVGNRLFGGTNETRPILQKGDNFRPPYDRHDRQRFLREYLTGTGGKPQAKFIRQLMPKQG